MAERDMSTRGIASGIYGLVVAGATLATSAAFESLRTVAAAVLVTVLVYWAAESYAHALATRVVLHRALTRGESVRVVRQGWPMVSASYVPLLSLLVAGLVGAGVTTAVLTALIVTTVLLGVAGATAGWSSGVRGVRLVATVAISLAFGLVMIGLKLSLH
jgi:hypothetical protein